MQNRWKRAALATLLVVASSCGGDDDASTTTTSQPARIIATTVPVATVPATVAGTVTTPTSTTQVPAVSNYTVVSGDSLSVIATRFGVTTADIMAINGITDPNRVSVGQVLVIPAAGVTVTTVAAAAADATSDTTAAPAAAPVVDGQAYIVGDGESLGFIAIKFNTTVAAIVAANGLTDPDRVGVGDTLIIPAG